MKRSYLPRPARVDRTKTEKLQDQVAARIADLITSQDLQPGARLPQTSELATMFGVSRTVVREALSVLSGRNLVEVKHGKGVFVARPSSASNVDPALLQLVHRAGARNILEVRMAVELVTAELAAERATSQDLVALDDALARVVAAAPGSDAAISADAEFHRTIARATQNPALEIVVGALIEAFRPPAGGTGSKQRTPESYERILVAIWAHNPRAARQAMHEHLAIVERNLEWTEVVHRMREASLLQPSGI